jgi:hypothetical protein
VSLRDLWRGLTGHREPDDKGADLRPGLDKLPAVDHFVQPPKPTGQDKPKY